MDKKGMKGSYLVINLNSRSNISTLTLRIKNLSNLFVKINRHLTLFLYFFLYK